jgi:hypothetical protein
VVARPGMSMPSAWIVAAIAAVAGAGIGAATAGLRSQAVPWQVGGFRPGGGGMAGRGPGGAGGSVEAIETVHDFGTVGTGGSGSHDFVVTNTGTGPLRLTRGATSCTCTIADFEPDETTPDVTPHVTPHTTPERRGDGTTKVVPPGESTRVTLQWKGRGPGGPFRQQATILTDDPRRPEVVFVVEGVVVPTWKAVPETLLFSQVSATAGETATVQIFTFGTEPPRVAQAAVERSGGVQPPGESPAEASPSDWFTVTTRPLDAAEIAAETAATGGLLATVTARAGLPLGPFRALLTLTAEMPDEVVIEVPIEGSVSGDLSVVAAAWDRTRQALLLGTVSGKQGLRTQAFLTVRGPHRDSIQPTVREVVPDSLAVTVGTAQAVGTGSVVRIPLEISIPPGSRPANHLCSELGPAGRIVLDTGHPDSPTLTIPVCIAIGP